jgi:DNA (cytosine-5)-methyltransferase 1
MNRAITPREAALLMTFPPWFELPSKNSAAERVVGNAVPPTLFQSLSEQFVMQQRDAGNLPV